MADCAIATICSVFKNLQLLSGVGGGGSSVPKGLLKDKFVGLEHSEEKAAVRADFGTDPGVIWKEKLDRNYHTTNNWNEEYQTMN